MEEKIKIDDLDSKTRQYIDQIIRQSEEERKKSKRKFLSLWDEEIEERIRSKELTPEQAVKEDYDVFIKHEIREAIEQRLSSLRRESWDIFNAVQQQIAKKVDEAWRIEHDFGNHFWYLHKGELDTLTREKQHELYQEEYKKAHDNAEYWSSKRDEFGEIPYTMELLYCSICRAKPVVDHQSYQDQKVSNYTICDDCIKGAKDPKTIKNAELKCDYCGVMLYKYAYQNKLNDLLFNQAPADINVELEYGRLQIRIKCKHCKETSVRWIDWGWLA